MVPVPAISGKAIGIMDAVSGISSLYKRIPRIISKARKKMTSEPAMAKDFTSTPRKLSMDSPTNKKTTMINAETKVACSG